ncbi:MAG: BMP family ABC transporter substrate-binding protein [Ardenticatenales bacterium]|nr:BMP family ABC transporter substrate-binding protein [Ardenticatenales bacterium]
MTQAPGSHRLLLLLCALLLLACTPTPQDGSALQQPAGEPLKVVFVYIDPLGDRGWTWAHDQGRLAIEETFGEQVETSYVEHLPGAGDPTEAIRALAEQGYDVIFTTSFDFIEPTEQVAQEFPKSWFISISGDETAPNLSTVFGRMEMAPYLSGLVAGAATQSNQIGYIAAFDIPEVVRGLNAFTLGVRAVNPEAEVQVRYIGSWFAPEQEVATAHTLLEAGVDVLTQHQASTVIQQAAQEAGVASIGYHSDMRRFVGDSVLTSAVWDWRAKYTEVIGQILAGTYQSESYYGHEVVDLAPVSPQVSAATVAQVEGQETALRSGAADVFCGPLRSNTEVLVVEAGKCLTDAELFTMQWYAEGVVGDAPAPAPGGLGQSSDKAPAWQLIEPTSRLAP